jgi:hypothetical protein
MILILENKTPKKMKKMILLLLLVATSCAPGTVTLTDRINYNSMLAVADMDVELFVLNISPIHYSEWFVTIDNDSTYQRTAGRRIEGYNYVFVFTEYLNDGVYTFKVTKSKNKMRHCLKI